MRDRDEVGRSLDPIHHVLHLVDALPQRDVEPVHIMCADRQLMVLRDVVSVLVDGKCRHAAEACNRVIVGDAGNRVTALLVGLHDFGVGLPAVGQAAPRAAMRVQVRELPCSGHVRVRVQQAGTCELLGRWKPIHRRGEVGEPEDDDEERRSALQQGHACEPSLAETIRKPSRRRPPDSALGQYSPAKLAPQWRRRDVMIRASALARSSASRPCGETQHAT